MPRVAPTPAVPMGGKFDPDLSVAENARNAWERRREIATLQGSRNAKVLARRVFGRDDFEYETSLKRYPTVVTFEIEDELIGFSDGKFHLVEICPECTLAARFFDFDSLASFGGALERRENEEPFVCRECQYKLALADVKSGKRAK